LDGAAIALAIIAQGKTIWTKSVEKTRNDWAIGVNIEQTPGNILDLSQNMQEIRLE